MSLRAELRADDVGAIRALVERTGVFSPAEVALAVEVATAGLGSRLLAASEARAAGLGCRRLYVDTSGRADYAPARAFYERHGYHRAGTLDDFYAPGDAKVIYLKVLPGAGAR